MPFARPKTTSRFSANPIRSPPTRRSGRSGTRSTGCNSRGPRPNGACAGPNATRRRVRRRPWCIAISAPATTWSTRTASRPSSIGSSPGWGDPLSDIGWFCAECWRFGQPELEAGGIAPRAAFYRGYETESGVQIDDEAVRYWEVVAHLRWAVIALEQGHRHLSGLEPSLELALTGRITPELELAILRATGPERWRSAHA